MITDTHGYNVVFGDGGADLIHLEGSRADTIDGGAGNDTVYGGYAGDSVSGGDGNDILYGEVGDDTMEGGAGNDILYSNNKTVIVVGDDVVSYAHAAAAVHIDLDNFDWQDTGGAGIDEIYGFNALIGSGFDDTVLGSFAADTVWAGDGSDLIDGKVGNDQLFGQAGDDTLTGGDGKDTLEGGAGQDLLAGGEGHDSFVFAAVADSAVGAADLIQLLANADLIDLSGMDADVTADGDQAFSLVSAFSGHAGEAVLTYDGQAQVTRLELDVDGDGKADSEIDMGGDHSRFDHFVL